LQSYSPELLPHLHGPTGGLPQIEVITGPSGPQRPQDPPIPWHRAWRLRIFVIAFLAVLLPGAAWDFLRPAQYRAVATVLTAAPTGVGRGLAGETADLQHGAVQDRLLLGQGLLEETLARTRQDADPGPLDADGLRAILAVTPQPDTNLVELSATGNAPHQLAAIVNAWIGAYQDMRQRQVAEDVGTAVARLREEGERLGTTAADMRIALDRYRDENDIVTMERDGNSALARLSSVTTELNKVRDQLVEAQARQAALNAAIAKGDPVVPEGEQGALAEFERQAATLRAQITELNKRYTPVFIENNPTTSVIPEQLKQVEAKIAEKLFRGQRLVQAKAEQEVSQARSRVQILERQQGEDKRAAADFTRRFARYETLKSDLEGVEKLHRSTEAKLVEVQAKGQDRYPQVDVIEPAHPPASPFAPDYWGDLVLVLAAAGASALAAVLLLEFLAPRRREEPEPTQMTGVRIFAGAQPAGPGQGELPAQGGGAPTFQPQPASPELAPPPAGMLPGVLPRELLVAEVAALWALAAPAQRQLMALLLSGLTLDECEALTADNFDLSTGQVNVQGPAARTITLTPRVRELFSDQPLPLWRGTGVETPAARLALLASDAGVAHPHEIDATALRHTYVVFLVRQGARLSEIERRVGPVPTVDLLRYAPLSPAGPARPLSGLHLDYPLPGT
jgi:uncharacterized protein involved in exopolysaccharide biosynthesis